MRRVAIAIAGFGGVGRATGELLLLRRERYGRLYGLDVRLVAVCGSRAGIGASEGLEASQFNELVDGQSGAGFLLSHEPDILIEAGPSDIRTGNPGLAYIGEALDAGIHAIVISKGALVFDGLGLKRRAVASGALLKVSGATAAALPAIDLLDYNLRGSEVIRIDGIFNATTNFLLTAMMRDGSSLQTALRKAQEGGFAESDPRKDIEGWDTASKLLILANFGLDARLTMDDIAVAGLQGIDETHVDAWKTAGVVPKLIGSIERRDGGLKADVGIKLLAPTDVLAQVNGKDKAIRITTDTMGETIATSSAAEPLATASAALKDLEHILSTMGR